MSKTWLNQNLDAQLLIDGVICDPRSVWVHHQSEPFPGGHRYEFLCSGPDAATYFIDLPDVFDGQMEKSRASFVLQWMRWSFPRSEETIPFRYVLNTIEKVVKKDGVVRVFGECSPFVEG